MLRKNSLPMEIPKKRVAWIDVSRVLAALLIMYVHLSSPLLKTTGIHLFYNGRVPFFLVLAGYFLARNITWNKALDRALWLFIPYMIWNVLYLFLLSRPAGNSFQLADLAGIRDVFLPGMDLFSFGSVPHDVPPIGPSWFLRDIIILTLLTPLLARIKILLPPALLLFFSFCNMAPDPLVTLSLGSCAFYLLGVVLSSRRIDDIHLVLNKKFGVVFCVSILVSSAMVLLHSAGILSLWTETVAGMLLGVIADYVRRHLGGKAPARRCRQNSPAGSRLLPDLHAAPAHLRRPSFLHEIRSLLPVHAAAGIHGYCAVLFCLETFLPFPAAVSGPC